MTGVQIIIVRLETLLLPFQRTKSSLLEYPFSLLASPTVRIVVPVSISLSLSPRASFRRDVSQSKRFCNASMIYCTCRDLTSESFKRGATRTAILLPRSPLFRSHPTEPRKARRLIRGRADLPRNLYPPFHHPTSFIPLDLAAIRSSFNPFDFYTRWEGGG